MSPWTLNRCARAIARGAVFAYPTDTIWGFGCHPLLGGSVARILDIKGRAARKGVILLSSDLDYCRLYTSLDDNQLQPIREPVTRPTTWLLPASDNCPAWLCGAHPTVAIRITDHPLLRELCGRLESPLVSTSANRSGFPHARGYHQVRRHFADDMDFIVTGFEAGSGRPSEIKSLLTGEVTRTSP